jgi:HlyD family secretion protein
MKTKKLNPIIFSVLALLVSFSSCKKSDSDPDASGTFETTEVIVSAEGTGRLLEFNAEEGMTLTENQIVGYIDSTQLYLKKLQLRANQQALVSRRPDMQKQIATLEQQLATARTEKKRIENLLKDNAVATKQLDDVNAQIALLEKQITATKSTLSTTIEGISGDSNALDIQLKQIEDQLNKCRITSPISGTVLVKYAEKGELAAAGKALFKIADTDNMILRAYITNDQLSTIKIGQRVKVFVEYGERNKEYQGTITWISDKSEFTPKTIQTQDERANLVYAVKIGIKNDGYLKIGMYGDVKFN